MIIIMLPLLVRRKRQIAMLKMSLRTWHVCACMSRCSQQVQEKEKRETLYPNMFCIHIQGTLVRNCFRLHENLPKGFGQRTCKRFAQQQASCIIGTARFQWPQEVQCIYRGLPLYTDRRYCTVHYCSHGKAWVDIAGDDIPSSNILLLFDSVEQGECQKVYLSWERRLRLGLILH